MEQSTLMKLSICCTILAFLYVEVYCGALNEHEQECVKEYFLNKETIETWNIEPLIPEDDEQLQQYMSCYWKKLGYLNNHGNFNFDELFRVMHSDLKKRFRFNCVHIVNYIIVRCKESVTADSEGLKAVRMWNCLNNFAENIF